MKRKVFFALLLSGLATTVCAQTVKEWKDSLARLNDSIRLSPRSTDLRLRKAAINIQLGQWEYAVEEYDRVLLLDEKNLAALYYRAFTHTNLQHYDLARNDYERFLSIVPRHFEAQLGLAMVKRKLGRQLDTMEELNKLVQQYPDSVLAYAARAGYETDLKQYDAALYDWDEAIRRQPKNLDFIVSKVDILITMKRYSEAWAVLEESMRQGVPRSVLKPWIDRCK